MSENNETIENKTMQDETRDKTHKKIKPVKSSIKQLSTYVKLNKYKKKSSRRLITIIFLLFLLCLCVYASPTIGKYVGRLRQGEPIKKVTEDILGRKTIAIKEAILGESREKQQLIVMEQDIQVQSEVSSTLAGLKIFTKTKTIHSLGTGVYTVDMSGIGEESIAVDEKNHVVTLCIPRTKLEYVNVDIEGTQFEQTQKGMLAFGDIKLTQEQQQVLSEEIYNTMKEHLSDAELFKKADELALLKVWEIFYPLVEAVSDEYVLYVIFPNEEAVN